MVRTVKAGVQRLKHLARVLQGKDLWQRVQVDRTTETHGAERAMWTICPEGIDATSVVYAAGVGEDLSFDGSLIQRYGMTVHAFDPTPKSIRWVEQQDLPDALQFHPYGVAGFDGAATFRPPDRPEFVSFAMTDDATLDDGGVEAPVYRLSTIMARLGHDHIDILKMDIEGAEYAVLHDLLDQQLDVRQILVEFHHRFDGIPVEATRRIIQRLNEHGYHVFAVSATGEDYAFIRL